MLRGWKNGLNMKKNAIRYGVEYLDALGRQNVNDSTFFGKLLCHGRCRRYS